MPIFQNIPSRFYPCQDGTFSDHNRPRACAWHGGLKSDHSLSLNQGSNQADIFLIPLKDIFTEPSWFQNRAQHFSLRSVNNIVQAAQQGGFKWVNFDPITLWKNPADQKLYVLSGHSRTEAFSRLCALNAQAEGKDFCRIPAKIVAGIALQEAKKIALQSNTLATQETELERAAYYRKLRQSEDPNLKNLRKMATRMEGRNANTILALSFLHPPGKTWSALYALQLGDATSKNNLLNIARWIGNARMAYSQLSNQHENELYDWLVTHKGYGTSAHQISNENEFKARLISIINRRTSFGTLEESLNIQNSLTRSPVEQQYDQQLVEALQQVRRLEKELKTKIAELSNRGADEMQIQEITAGQEAALRRARIHYQQLLQQKGRVQQAARSEISLFDQLNGFLGRIVKVAPPGQTLCADQSYSTHAPGRGVCSYHGGVFSLPKAGYQPPKTTLDPKEVPPTNYYNLNAGQQWTRDTPFKQMVKELRALLRRVFPGVLVRIHSNIIGSQIVEVSHKDIQTLKGIGQFLFDNCSRKSDYAKKKYLLISQVSPIYLRKNDIQSLIFCRKLADQFSPEKVSLAPKSPLTSFTFPLPKPKRGTRFNNSEYEQLIRLINAQKGMLYPTHDKSIPPHPAFLDFYNRVKAWDDQMIKVWGEKWSRVFSDQPGGGYGDAPIHQRGAYHPIGMLKSRIDQLYQDFTNRWDLSSNPYKFNAFKNRTIEAVTRFFNTELPKVLKSLERYFTYIKDPFWFDPKITLQQKIDRNKVGTFETRKTTLALGLLEKIAQQIHQVNIDWWKVKEEKYKGKSIDRYSVFRGEVPLSFVFQIQKQKEEAYQQRKEDSALRLKKRIQELFDFHRWYLDKGYSFHLPTYTRKLKEHFKGGSIQKGFSATRQGRLKYLEIVLPNHKSGIRVMPYVIEGYEVQSIIISVALFKDCMAKEYDEKGIFFKCYMHKKDLDQIRVYLDTDLKLLHHSQLSGLPYSFRMKAPFYHHLTKAI